MSFAEERRQLLLVLVVVLLRVEGLSEVADELFRHRDLLWPHFLLLGVGETQVLRRDQFFLEPHQLENQRVAEGAHGHEMLLLAQRQLADPHHGGVLERLAQQGVRLLAPLLRHEVVAMPA